MTTRARTALCTAALLLAGSGNALANPSVAPGLWEYRTVMKTNDASVQAAMAEAQKALAGMPPEQRRQMEQMLAAQGIGVSVSGQGQPMTTIRVCISPEEAARQELPSPDDDCTQRITGRTAQSLRFAIECPAEKMRGEGEVRFKGPKAYDGRFTMQGQHEGQPMRVESTLEARWVSADCGAIKPDR